MDNSQKKWSSATLPESSIVFTGLLLTIFGLIFRDPTGITSLLTVLGIGLFIGGLVYIAVEGPELIRLTLAFVSLLALQLVFFGGVVRWIGGIMIGTVIVSTSYSRLSK